MTPVSERAAVGLYLSGVGLESLLDDLTAVGLYDEDVFVILPPTHPVARTLLSSRSRSASTSLEIDDASRWWARFGAVIIPGSGAFVAGREFDMLFTSTDGDTACDSPLQALGFPPAQEERHQSWAQGGGVVIYVFCETEDQVHHAIEVLEEAGAEEVLQMDTQAPQLKSTPPLLRVS